ncbi:hypothetical protein WOB59_01175 [Methylocystis sp. IM4]|uniref:hypothetical protein n=1 Tax=Methylocystis sp. IM4 TaxID=3136560 RepID=UPI003119E254
MRPPSHRNRVSDLTRLTFQGGVGIDPGADAAARLLHHMSEFVAEEPPPGGRLEVWSGFAERDMLADRIGARVDGGGGAARPRVGVDANAREIMIEAILHPGPRRGRQRLARGAQDVADHLAGRHARGRGAAGPVTL